MNLIRRVLIVTILFIAVSVFVMTACIIKWGMESNTVMVPLHQNLDTAKYYIFKTDTLKQIYYINREGK